MLESGVVGLAQAVETVQLVEDGGAETVGEIVGWRTKPRPAAQFSFLESYTRYGRLKGVCGIGASQAAFVRGEGAHEKVRL